MDTIKIYTFEDARGNQVGCFSVTDIAEAREYAVWHGLRIICRTYQFEGSAAVEDYTEYPEGDDEEDVVLWDEYDVPAGEGGSA